MSIDSGVNVDGLVFKPMIRLATEANDAYAPYSAASVAVSFANSGGNPLTVYGGTLDITSGKLKVTHGYLASYAGEMLPGAWISDRDVYAAGTLPTTGAQVVYELAVADQVEYTLTPQQLATLAGNNTISAALSGSGDVASTTAPVTVEYRTDPALTLGAENNN